MRSRTATGGICCLAVVGCRGRHGVSYCPGVLSVLMPVLCAVSCVRNEGACECCWACWQLLQNMSCPAAVCLVPQFFVCAVLSSRDWCCCCLALLTLPFGGCTSCTPQQMHTHLFHPLTQLHRCQQTGTAMCVESRCSRCLGCNLAVPGLVHHRLSLEWQQALVHY